MNKRATFQGESEVKVTPFNGREKKVTPNQESGGRYVGLKEGAILTGLSFWTFREYVSAGLIPSVRLPHPFKDGKRLARILVDVKDIEAFMNKHKTQTPSDRY